MFSKSLSFNTYLCLAFRQCGLVANRLDYDIIASEFELQLGNNIHFQTNAFENCMNPLINQAMG